ncbi:recombinase family protein [Dietzia sp. MNB45]|uniref:recombinase family protein n=1 Tax=Dietzia sp. MNB45 TaxID=3238800 RepID=UPI003F7F3DF0
MQHRTAIYSRISEDPKRTGLGVARQLEDCRNYALERGWDVVAELSDNDISAYSGKPRPGYRSLLELIKSGQVDYVLAWHTDRLHRRLRELVEYCDVVTGHNVLTFTVKSGDLDLSTPSGIMMAQIKGAVDEAYVSEARLKNKRARRQIAEAGKRHSCGRVYGWQDGGNKIEPAEADVVRELVRRIIAGETPTAIAADLNDRGIPTVRGARWTGIGVRKCAGRASNAAIREHNGRLHYNGQWEPIITREEYEQVTSVLSKKVVHYRRSTGRKYLLTGLVYCECGNKISATVGSGERKPAYRCKTYLSNDHRRIGCGKVSRNIAALELLTKKAILKRLESPKLLEVINTHSSNESAVKTLVERRGAQQQRVDELVNDYATGLLTASQFRSAKELADATLDNIDQQLARVQVVGTMTMIDLTRDLATQWESGGIAFRRNLVDLLVERVTVHPLPQGHPRVMWEGFRFDPSLVDVGWRV